MANLIAQTHTLPIRRIKYAYAALKALIRIKRFDFELSIDNKIIDISESFMIVLSNGKWEGGVFLISPTSNPTDEMMEVSINIAKDRSHLFIQLLKFFLFKKVSTTSFRKYSCKSAHIRVRKPIPTHCDGEIVDNLHVVDFKLLPKALQILSF